MIPILNPILKNHVSSVFLSGRRGFIKPPTVPARKQCRAIWIIPLSPTNADILRILPNGLHNVALRTKTGWMCRGIHLSGHLSPRFLAESVGSGSTTTKPKRRAYLLKRKALTTGFFDNKGKDEKEKGEHKERYRSWGHRRDRSRRADG